MQTRKKHYNKDRYQTANTMAMHTQSKTIELNSDLEDEASELIKTTKQTKLPCNFKDAKFVKTVRKGVYSKNREKIQLELKNRTHLPAWCFNETFRSKYGLADGGSSEQGMKPQYLVN